MSGTSADGIDAVVAEIADFTSRAGVRARILAHQHRAFAPPLRKRILGACVAGKVAEICELNFLLGRHFGQAALRDLPVADAVPEYFNQTILQFTK